MQKKELVYFSIFAAIGLSVFVYGKIRCLLKNNKKFQDPLSKNINIYADGWLMSHFVFFAFIGYYYPDKLYISMTLGFLWEILEILIGTIQPKFLQNIAKCTKIDLQKQDAVQVNNNEMNWFYGRYEDILIDFLGFVTGYFIKNYNFSF